jgi:endonuclease/exonuclease/phosphatase family metal-dependent hydrolase
LTSVYHEHHGETHGAETRPTYFLYRHRHRPYHLDYCFLPTAWMPRVTQVEVGTHEAWSRWSDHMPLTVEVRATEPRGE